MPKNIILERILINSIVDKLLEEVGNFKVTHFSKTEKSIVKNILYSNSETQKSILIGIHKIFVDLTGLHTKTLNDYIFTCEQLRQEATLEKLFSSEEMKKLELLLEKIKTIINYFNQNLSSKIDSLHSKTLFEENWNSEEVYQKYTASLNEVQLTMEEYKQLFQ